MSGPQAREEPHVDPLGAAAIARLAALTEIVRAVARSDDYDSLLLETARSACQALGGSSVSVSCWDRSTGQLRTLVNDGVLAPWEVARPSDEVYSVRRDPALTDLVLEGHGYVVNLDDQENPVLRDVLVETKKRSALDVPIVLEGQVWGDLWVSRGAGLQDFTERDLDFATVVAAQVATAIAAGERLARISRLAFTDPLTGLANRRAVDERIELALSEHLSVAATASLLVCDVNGLKGINDEGGHEAGDRTLVRFAAELSASAALAPGSLAARLGGDEFCIVMNGISSDLAVAVADDLVARAARVIPLGVSCGVASTEDDVGLVRTPGRLFRLADAAQYRAKRNRSPFPVVAGRSLATVTKEVVADPVEPDTLDVAAMDRRTVRGRARTDVVRVLEIGLSTLDDFPGLAVNERLELVGDLLARSLDASGWWVSVQPAESRLVRTVGYAGQRARSAETGQPEEEIGSEFDLANFPRTREALAGTAVVLSVDDPDADPPEVAIMQGMGCLAILMVGAADSRGDHWLLEVFGDEISAPLRRMAAVARALVAVAVAAG